jgi:hypothetical protein
MGVAIDRSAEEPLDRLLRGHTRKAFPT